MLSECQLQIIEYSSFSLDKNKDLIQSRKEKKKKEKKKKLHYQNLKLYLNLGIQWNHFKYLIWKVIQSCEEKQRKKITK